MSPRWLATVLVAAGVFVVIAGLVDDVVRAVIWEALAAVGLLVWYGPARRLWKRGNR
jgi:hypothetical protein